MDSQPNVTPSRTWWEWLPDNLIHHRKRAATILERHNHILDPTAYAHVHQIATEGIDPGLIQSIRQHDIQAGFPRPRILGSYWTPPDGYFESVLSLLSWCEDQVKLLEGAGVRGLRHIDPTIGPWDLKEKPLSMIDGKKLMDQISALNDFRKKHDA